MNTKTSSVQATFNLQYQLGHHLKCITLTAKEIFTMLNPSITIACFVNSNQGQISRYSLICVKM